MQIREIYKRFRVNRGLEKHMIRVASVVKMVSMHSKLDVDETLVISAALIHDMGNLAKARDMEIFSHLFEPEGVPYWRDVRSDIWEKYGKSAHEVTLAYLRELGVSHKLYDAVDCVGLEHLIEVTTGDSVENKLLIYADLRVGPDGILSYQDRMEDIVQRYVPQKHTVEEIKVWLQSLDVLEALLFADSDISPEDITDESTAEIQKELWEWDVETTK